MISEGHLMFLSQKLKVHTYTGLYNSYQWPLDIYRALQFIPVATSPWLVRKHFLLANKSMLLARLIKIPIRTIQLQYVFICT
jgi:hypothetical protein